MNILLSNSTDLFAGGEDYVLILAKHLKRRGHTVWVSALPDHLLLRKCEEVGIGTVPMAYEGMMRIARVASILRKELRSKSIDVVHSNANYDRTCVALAVVGTRSRHVASVHSAYSIQYNITHWVRNRWGIDHFIADAEAVKNVLVREDHISPQHITVVPIGAENDADDIRKSVRIGIRRELGIDEKTLVIGNVARLVPFKGHRYLLETISQVVRYRRDVLFPIVGDGELMETLSIQARELGIEPYVRFLGFRNDVELLYPSFDIYCHSSLELAAEAFPPAILRALAAGLPVVCTNIGGIGRMVNEGISGYLTKPEDPLGMAEALLRLLGDAELRESMGRSSLNLFLSKFHASAMAKAVEEIYRKECARQ